METIKLWKPDKGIPESLSSFLSSVNLLDIYIRGGWVYKHIPCKDEAEGDWHVAYEHDAFAGISPTHPQILEKEVGVHLLWREVTGKFSGINAYRVFFWIKDKGIGFSDVKSIVILEKGPQLPRLLAFRASVEEKSENLIVLRVNVFHSDLPRLFDDYHSFRLEW